MASDTSKLTFHGGAGSVTGANFLLNTGTSQLMIDCGLVQGGDFGANSNYEPFPYEPGKVDALVVTHAHADHIGRIPKLVRDGFSGPIYSTSATRDLAEVMFDDATGILAEEALKLGREPLYTKADVNKVFPHWQTLNYGEGLQFKDGVSAKLLDAGHILGSAMIEFTRNGEKFVATGDLGNSPAPLLPDTQELNNVQYLLTESVYGDRVHENREDRLALLKDILIETHREKRTLLIPAFAMQRTQILLYEMNKFVESKEVPEMPVYLDSPLASKVTNIYRNYTHLFNKRVREEIQGGDDIFEFPQFTIIDDSRESRGILNAPSPKVIIGGSGMSVGGRILLHEKRFLSDKNATVLFVGYQGVGTLGRRIQDGAHTVHVDGKTIRVRARKATIRGFSAHKDRDNIIDFIANTADSLKHVFVAMGEPSSSLFLVQRLRDFLGIKATAPKAGDTVTLNF
jgi:metallo-beta-lactamase family protein